MDKYQVIVQLVIEKEELERLCAMQELRVPLHEGESAQIVLDVPQSLRAPGYAGQHIGTAQVVVGGKTPRSSWKPRFRRR